MLDEPDDHPDPAPALHSEALKQTKYSVAPDTAGVASKIVKIRVRTRLAVVTITAEVPSQSILESNVSILKPPGTGPDIAATAS